MASIFRRGKRDAVLCRVPSEIAELLVEVLTQVEDAMRAPQPGPVTDRLFPRAYLDPTEEEAEQEWQSLVHDDLAQARTDALAATVAELRDAPRVSRGDVEVALDEEAAMRWCLVLNDARLMLGTALEVRDDEELEFDEHDPRAAGADLYHLLTNLQGQLIEVLAEDLPDEGSNDEPAF